MGGSVKVEAKIGNDVSVYNPRNVSNHERQQETNSSLQPL